MEIADEQLLLEAASLTAMLAQDLLGPGTSPASIMPSSFEFAVHMMAARAQPTAGTAAPRGMVDWVAGGLAGPGRGDGSSGNSNNSGGGRSSSSDPLEDTRHAFEVMNQQLDRQLAAVGLGVERTRRRLAATMAALRQSAAASGRTSRTAVPASPGCAVHVLADLGKEEDKDRAEQPTLLHPKHTQRRLPPLPPCLAAPTAAPRRRRRRLSSSDQLAAVASSSLRGSGGELWL